MWSRSPSHLTRANFLSVLFIGRTRPLFLSHYYHQLFIPCCCLVAVTKLVALTRIVVATKIVALTRIVVATKIVALTRLVVATKIVALTRLVVAIKIVALTRLVVVTTLVAVTKLVAPLSYAVKISIPPYLNYLFTSISVPCHVGFSLYLVIRIKADTWGVGASLGSSSVRWHGCVAG